MKPKPDEPSVTSLRLRERRLLKHWTQEDLAIKIGVNKSLVGHWETGRARVSLDDLEKLAEVLETSKAYLLGIETPTFVTVPSTGSVNVGRGTMRIEGPKIEVLALLLTMMSEEDQRALTKQAFELAYKPKVGQTPESDAWYAKPVDVSPSIYGQPASATAVPGQTVNAVDIINPEESSDDV